MDVFLFFLSFWCVCLIVFLLFSCRLLQMQLYSGVPGNSGAVPGDTGGGGPYGLGRSFEDSGVPWLLRTRWRGRGRSLGIMRVSLGKLDIMKTR